MFRGSAARGSVCVFSLSLSLCVCVCGTIRHYTMPWRHLPRCYIISVVSDGCCTEAAKIKTVKYDQNKGNVGPNVVVK